jgi:SAM-dependent methyltransferase
MCSPTGARAWLKKRLRRAGEVILARTTRSKRGARQQIDLMDTAAVRQFVDRSDELGGPDANATIAWWKQVECVVPGSLRAAIANFEPLSPGYFDLQEQLYTSISGRTYSDAECELTPFDQNQAVRALAAYPNRSPKNLNRYFHAVAKLADQFDAEGPCDVLELGSGWGFSTEYMARLGHRVVGVDINPDFVSVASRRSAAAGLGIDYRQGTFERPPIRLDERFDVVFSFGALHHCRHPLTALQGIRRVLRPTGQLILAGEPFIDAAMWPAWGLRTDPLAVYCIAKFGWWESGWTIGFMADLFRRIALQMSFVDFHTDMERYMVGRVGAADHLSRAQTTYFTGD